MKRIFHVTLLLCIAVAGQPVLAGESLDYSIARGGKLYDKWFKTNSTDAPKTANPAYPDSGKYKGKKASDWRCKECHGWDYLGKDGNYSKGKHFTGTGGVLQASGKSEAQLASLLRDKNHGYTAEMLSSKDVADLSNFLQKGMVDMDKYIDRASKKPSGDVNKGEAYYQTICAGCHGLDGKEEDTAPPLGQLSNKNPWEILHKILNGQPGAEMTAMRALDMQISVDILTYLQTLPKE
jgi:thiosulfate dehydrogenase